MSARAAPWCTSAARAAARGCRCRSGPPTAPRLRSHSGRSPKRRWWALAQQRLESTNVLDGKRVAAVWTAEIAQEVAEVTRVLRRPPGLAVVLVGSRPDSVLYVSRKQEACRQVGRQALGALGAGG